MKHLMVLSIAWLTGCAHYRGAGPIRTSADYDGSETKTTTWAGGGGAAGFRLNWPVERVRVNRGFRPPSDRRHEGVDLGGGLNTPVLAAHDGRVVYAGHHFRGYGNMVLLEYDGHWATLYGHLNHLSVREGGRVRAGEVLGLMGRTGLATGVHLHFEVLAERLPVDPMEFLPALTHGLAER